MIHLIDSQLFGSLYHPLSSGHGTHRFLVPGDHWISRLIIRHFGEFGYLEVGEVRMRGMLRNWSKFEWEIMDDLAQGRLSPLSLQRNTSCDYFASYRISNGRKKTLRCSLYMLKHNGSSGKNFRRVHYDGIPASAMTIWKVYQPHWYAMVLNWLALSESYEKWLRVCMAKKLHVHIRMGERKSQWQISSGHYCQENSGIQRNRLFATWRSCKLKVQFVKTGILAEQTVFLWGTI